MPIVTCNNENLYIGVDYPCPTDLTEIINRTRCKRVDFALVPLVHPRNYRQVKDFEKFSLPLARSDLVIDGRLWSSCVAGSVSRWLKPDSTDEETARIHKLLLTQELSWAAHLCVHSIVLPSPELPCTNYANVLSQFVSSPSSSHTRLWIRLSIKPCQNGDQWKTWNQLRTFCDYHNSICIALELSEDLPSCKEDLDIWFGEPVKALIIPTTTFLSTKDGKPVLSPQHRDFVCEWLRHKVHLVIQAPDRPYDPNATSFRLRSVVHADDWNSTFLSPSYWPIIGQNNIPLTLAADTMIDTKHDQDGHIEDKYLEYINSLCENQPAWTTSERVGSPYSDCLQTPLQPLQDNLESQTYETFEKDPIKYSKYQYAIHECLKDRLKSTEIKNPVLMVVGAGRGPLVQRALKALDALKIVDFTLYAVEKNSNAVNTLRGRVSQGIATGTEWGRVKVIAGDIRHITSLKERADIIISELLGSFGDNELSPECLDGAQQYLKEDGTFIPCEYWSSIEPLSTTKIWNDVRSWNDMVHWETAYVVNIRSATPLSCEGSKVCFRFNHPYNNTNGPMHLRNNAHNTRYKEISFTSRCNSLMHGFAGYFHCTLYGDVTISINPKHATHGMFSWFPIFFPLKWPVQVNKGDTIVCHVWRKTSPSAVWYEWCLSSPQATSIHNPNGRSYSIGR
eukprot:GHVL01018784.1.p1 GENE.GHVL01018784.1~~GHVL01018784.1.p1  ORF type:complete len:678 (-),score=65.29 GHVL01018784.1:1760-3793(-)